MIDIAKWSHKDEWHQSGEHFLVVVKHYTETPNKYSHDGPHRWNVYAYIYPKHRLFETFKGPEMWQPAATELPLHGGPSLLRWHLGDDGKPTSVQVGADYYHLHDEEFSYYATPSDASEVFNDADKLFQHLSKVEL
jgi:hypothetical protein